LWRQSPITDRSHGEAVRQRDCSKRRSLLKKSTAEQECCVQSISPWMHKGSSAVAFDAKHRKLRSDASGPYPRKTRGPAPSRTCVRRGAGPRSLTKERVRSRRRFPRKRGRVLPISLAHWLKAEVRAAPIGHDRGRREASSAASLQRASRSATAWPVARCRRHTSAVRGNLPRILVTIHSITGSLGHCAGGHEAAGGQLEKRL
jgi:hypothetical protein